MSTAATWDRVGALWTEAANLEGAERADYLEAACEGDPELRREIETLLRAGERTEDRFERLVERVAVDLAAEGDGTSATAAPSLTAAGALEGETFGYVRIEERIGHGGMGRVYRGVDERLGREVALKVLDPVLSLDHRMGAAIEREARLLSQLRHPSICQIHDLVRHDGHAGLVLELVPGRPLSEMPPETIDREQALRWGLEIVEGIAAAHQQRIVHRDLKPSNVMVTPEGSVKILDFGIARRVLVGAPTVGDAVGSGDAGWSITRAALGTPRYMSPEQARGEPATPASDVYAVGLLMIEVLTGEPVYAPDLSPAELAGRVAEGAVDVPPGLGPELTDLLRRLVDPAPGARPSARDAAERLRWLLAAPARRRARMLRHGAIAAALLVAIVFAWQAVRVFQEGERANREAVRAREEAARANQQAETAERVTAFLVGLFGDADPLSFEGGRLAARANGGEGVSARTLLERGIAELEGDQDADPAIRSQLLMSVAEAAFGIGLNDEAQRLTRQALALRRAHYGDRHPQVARSLTLLSGFLVSTRVGSEEASRAATEAIDILQGSANVADLSTLVEAWTSLNSAARDRGDYEVGEHAARRALAIQETLYEDGSPERASAMVSLGWTLMARGGHRNQPEKRVEAKALVEQALPILSEHLGDAHQQTIEAWNLLSEVLVYENDYERAIEIRREIVESVTRVLGRHHHESIQHRETLARVVRRAGHLDEADPIYAEVAVDAERLYGSMSPELYTLYENWAFLDLARSDPVAAEGKLRRALAITEAHFPADSPWRGSVELGLGAALAEQGKYADAERMMLGVLRRFEGTEHSNLQRRARRFLTHFYETAGEPEKADPYRDPPPEAGP